jgi:hypothetical protein
MLAAGLITSCLFTQPVYANGAGITRNSSNIAFRADSVPPSEVMDVIQTVISATNNFNIASVSGIYTPNAVVADDEPPYSWNGPTAGIQWVNSVEKACKELRITKLKAFMATVTIFHQSGDNVYLIVPLLLY